MITHTYYIAGSYSLPDLLIEVNTLFSKGWAPQGDLQGWDTENGPYYVQSVVYNQP